MVRLRLQERLKGIAHFMVSPPPQLDPTVRYPVRPRYALLWLIIGSFVIWYYFEVEISYDSIPAKPLFWLAFVGWAMPGIVAEWAYRNLPSKSLIDKFGNVFILVGLCGISVGILTTKTELAVPVAYAMLPGFLVGAAIGSDSLLLWRIINSRGSKTDGGKAGSTHGHE